MEWGAAELFKATGEPTYLEDAIRYARMAGPTSWMQHDTAEHYEYYPFVNVGHFALYPLVDPALRDTLAGYYRDGIERTMERGRTNPYGIGVPFIWCSNNLATALITQILLYEKMTGDRQYHDFMLRQRDWLLGRNPWGTSMFTGIPRDGERPVDVHTSVWALTKREVPGGLVDGPVLLSVYSNLRGPVGLLKFAGNNALLSRRVRRVPESIRGLPRRHRRLCDERAHDGRHGGRDIVDGVVW
jgi:hypothetical protein